MKIKPIYFLSIFATLLIAGCKQSFVGSKSNTSLLLNDSFEMNGIPTLQGWLFGNEQLATLVNDAAPNGGKWALRLSSDWAPTTGYIYKPVTNIKPGDIVKLSAYVRGTGPHGGCGIIQLTYNKQTKSATSCDTLWNNISVVDTLSSGP